MDRIDLKDVTFLIPVRIDSSDRMENLELVVDYIKTNYHTTLMVLETDKAEKIFNDKIDKKIFIEDHDTIFHRTKYLNELTKLSSTEYLAIWDTDVLIPPEQIKEAINILRKKNAQMAFPYDGRFYNTPKTIKEEYGEKRTFELFDKNLDMFGLGFGNHSVGGAFMVNREHYINAGGENENFYGWGDEDVERVKRWEILGYDIKRINGPLFHLHHGRYGNSWYGSKVLEYNNRKELIRICQMDRETLAKEIKIKSKEAIDDPLKIGMIVIAIGEDKDRAMSLIATARRLFLKGHDVQFFVFSNQYVPKNDDMTWVKIKHKEPHLPFFEKPHCICNHQNLFVKMDYLFMCDANMLFVDKVGDEILPKEPPFLVGVEYPNLDAQHPMTNKKKSDTNKSDLHYTEAFIGGKKNSFLQMAKTIKEHIDSDLGGEDMDVQDIETYINAYYTEHHPKLLHPGYCFPGLSKLPFQKKIVTMNKSYMAAEMQNNE